MQLTIERLSAEQEKEFRVQSAQQIQNLLHDISEKGVLAALYYDGAKDFIMTSLLDVGEEGFWVEQGVDMPKNQRIVESKRLTMVCVLDQVKIQFAVERARAVTHHGYPAFYLGLPANVYRLQHREYFRLTIPNSAHLLCMVPVKKPHAVKQHEIPIMDISVGGLRLFYTDNEIEFVPGQIYGDCQINLPEAGKISVTITVKSVFMTSPKPGQTVKRVGCEFINLDNASMIRLQRYVTNMQRQGVTT